MPTERSGQLFGRSKYGEPTDAVMILGRRSWGTWYRFTH